jgi:hypothetical protein
VSEHEENGVFVRVTNREIWQELRDTKDQVSAIRSDLSTILKENSDLREDILNQDGRIERLESRFNGVLVGIGTGIVVGLIAVFRGIIGG